MLPQQQAPAPAASACLPYVSPFGATLHYPGCGCPQSAVHGRRAADFVDVLLQRCCLGVTANLLLPTRKLRVGYMLPHHNITGGMKCLVEHVRLLRSRGHTVIAIHRSDTAQRAMPPWTDVAADVDIVCKLHQRLVDVCPVQDLDVVVVGIFHQVAEVLAGVPAPVLYWEQGHEWVFGDPVRFQVQHNYLKQDQLFHLVMHLPVALASVSGAVQSILSQEFGRATVLVPNGVDCTRFSPGPRADLPPTQVYVAPNCKGSDEGEAASVLLVGNPSLPLKGFDTALAVLALVNALLPLRVTWVCQVPPSEQALPVLATSGLRIALHINPRQDELPLLYRGHDALLFTSRYEAWGMPVMEAMASGLPCVVTKCLGVCSFAEHGVNCLLAEAQDVLALSQQLITLLTNPQLKMQLSTAGRSTALRFTPETIADRLESVLYSLTAASKELLALRQIAATDIQFACAWAAHACARAPTVAAPQEPKAS